MLILKSFNTERQESWKQNMLACIILNHFLEHFVHWNMKVTSIKPITCIYDGKHFPVCKNDNIQRLQLSTKGIRTHCKIFEKVFTQYLCRHGASGCSGRRTSSQEVRVRKELILSTVSSATSASCISSSWWQLSLITYTMRPTQMKMRRIIPITWSTKELVKTVQ